MKKIGYIVFSLTLIMLVITGCSAETSGESKASVESKETEDAKTYKYEIPDDELVEEFYLKKTKYYSDKVVIYWDGTIDNLETCRFSDDFEIDGNKLVLETKQPDDFNAFSMDYGDYSFRFRYLDSDHYACICTVVDSEGGLHDSGSPELFYTDEEKEKQQQQAQKRQEEQDALFERLSGIWTAEDGDYFKIYKEVDYAIEYSLDRGEREGTETSVIFTDYLYVLENNIGISYIDGPFTCSFDIVIAEDGQSFEYNEKVFYRGYSVEKAKYNVDSVLEILGTGIVPPYYCEFDHIADNGNIVIHIYESVDNGTEAHTATVDWIEVNLMTGDCVAFNGDTFNLSEFK